MENKNVFSVTVSVSCIVNLAAEDEGKAIDFVNQKISDHDPDISADIGNKLAEALRGGHVEVCDAEEV